MLKTILFALLILPTCVNAALINETFTGSWTNVSSNPFGLTSSSEIILDVTYDPAWIENKTRTHVQGSFNVINIIDYRSSGAKLSLSLGGRVFHEFATVNPIPSSHDFWDASVPILIFDNDNNVVSFTSYWTDPISSNSEFHLTSSFSNEFSIEFFTYTPFTSQIIEGEIHFPAAVPVPSALWLFISGLFAITAIQRRSKS